MFANLTKNVEEVRNLEGWRRFTPVTPFLELFAFLDLIQDASNGIRPLRYPHEQAFLKTNWSVLAPYVLTNEFWTLLGFSFSLKMPREKRIWVALKIILWNPGEYNLFIDSKIRVSLTKTLFGKTTIKYIYIFIIYLNNNYYK